MSFVLSPGLVQAVVYLLVFLQVDKCKRTDLCICKLCILLIKHGAHFFVLLLHYIMHFICTAAMSLLKKRGQLVHFNHLQTKIKK